VIGDLGVSKALSTPDEYLNTLQGTVLYLSPEICKHTPYTSKTDCWSLGMSPLINHTVLIDLLGVILYELCTLFPPFTGESLIEITQKIMLEVF